MIFGAFARRAVFTTATAIGVLAVFGLGVLSIAPLLFPASDVRKAATEALALSTGHKARIGGDPRVSLFPTPAVMLEKVDFPMAGGLSMDADSVVARLRILPLLIGRLEVADVTLERPTLVVTGRSRLLSPALIGLIAGPNQPDLRLVGGTIAMRNAEGLTEELVSGIDGRLDRSAGGGALVTRLTFTWRDRTTQTTLELGNALAFLAGQPVATSLDITSGTSWVRFNGVSSSGVEASVNGDLSGEATSLRDLLTWVNLPLPTAGGLERFTFSGKIAADRVGVQLSAVTADLDGNRSEGALSVKLDGERPLIEGTFAADALDLTPYGRLVMTDASGGAWDRTALNLRPLSRMDLDLRLSAARMRAEDSVFERVATSAVLRSGHLVLALGTAQAWGGNVRASLDLAPSADGASTSVRVAADGTGISFDQALGDVLSVRRIEGKGDLQVKLEGSGASYFDIAQSLSGTVSMQVSNGAVAGIDIGQVMRRIERRPLSGGGDLRGGRTAFDQLAAKIIMDQGVATLQKADMEGKQVRLTLGGEVAIGSREIDLQGHAILLPAGNGAGERAPAFDMPFIVQGPWSSPYVMLDPQSLIQRSGAAQPLLEAVRSKGVGEAAVRSVIEQLAKPTALPPAPTKAGN